MSEGSVNIRSLRLRTPLDRARARGLGERTAQRVLTLLAARGLDGKVGDLNIQITAEVAKDPERLAQQIVAEIKRRVR